MTKKQRWYVSVSATLTLFLLAPVVATAGGDSEAAAETEVLEITWLMKPQYGSETTWFIQELEKVFPVKITPNLVHPHEGEKITIMLGAGEFPDAGYIFDRPINLYQEGVTRGIPKDMIREHMPNFSKMVDSEYPIGWSLDNNPDNKDEVLCIQGVQAFTDTGLFYLNFRSDWAKNVGIELPDYEKKKISLDRFGRVYFYDEVLTLDWFERLLVAFRDGDPDGNGKIDTIPLGAFNSISWSWGPLMGAFGVSPLSYHNLEVDGELYHWQIAPGFKDFLKQIADWYGQGLVDKEFANLDRTKAYEKVEKGLVGAVAANMNYPGIFYAMNRPPNSIVRDEELGTGAESVMIPPVSGPTGLHGTHSYEAFSGMGTRNGFMVNRNVSDEKLVMILKILDYMLWGDDETWIYGQFGQPGVHLDWEGEPFNSTPIPRKENEIPEGNIKDGYFGTYYPDASTKSRIRFTHPKHMAEFYNNYLLAAPGLVHTIRTYRYDIMGETKAAEIWKENGATLNTLQQEFMYDAIYGNIDIDSKWDTYVAQWRRNGGDSWLAEMEKTPIVAEARKGNIVY